MSKHIIVALDRAGGFSKNDTMPWNIPEDFKHFKDTTQGGICVMGRKTYEDMVAMRTRKSKKKKKKNTSFEQVLLGRTSYVVTSSDIDLPGAERIRDMSEAFSKHPHEKVFILGGEKMFIQAMAHVDTVIVTVIDHDFQCNKFFPVEILQHKFVISSGKKIPSKEFGDLMVVEYTRKK